MWRVESNFFSQTLPHIPYIPHIKVTMVIFVAPPITVYKMNFNQCPRYEYLPLMGTRTPWWLKLYVVFYWLVGDWLTLCSKSHIRWCLQLSHLPNYVNPLVISLVDLLYFLAHKPHILFYSLISLCFYFILYRLYAFSVFIGFIFYLTTALIQCINCCTLL